MSSFTNYNFCFHLLELSASTSNHYCSGDWPSYFHFKDTGEWLSEPQAKAPSCFRGLLYRSPHFHINVYNCPLIISISNIICLEHHTASANHKWHDCAALVTTGTLHINLCMLYSSQTPSYYSTRRIYISLKIVSIKHNLTPPCRNKYFYHQTEVCQKTHY